WRSRNDCCWRCDSAPTGPLGLKLSGITLLRRRHYLAALFAGAIRKGAIKPVEHGLEVGFDVLEREVLLVEQAIAAFAVPLQTVLFSGLTLALDDETDRVGHSLRRV